MLRVFGLSLVMVLCISSQTPDTASIRGQIVDQTGGVIKDASVSLLNRDTGAKRSVVADAAGLYQFSGLPLTGSYQLTIAKDGFASEQPAGLTLRGNEIATVNVVLKPAGGQSSVTVLASAEGIRADSPDIATTLNLQKIENTPVLGRKITSLPLLNAAVRGARGQGDLFLNNTLFVVNGSGRRQVPFIIDGSNGNEDWARQSIFTNLPFAALEEFTLSPNNYSADFGRSTGSVVNVVTKSGTNDLHSDLSYMIRPGAIEAAAPDAPRRTEDRMQQVSGVLSGPLAKDRTHFLLTGEYNDEHRDAPITSPLAPGIFTGDFRQWMFLGRVDQKIDNRNRAAFRFNLDRFSDTNPTDGVSGNVLPSAARTFYKDCYTTQFSENMAVSPSAINELRLQFQLGSPVTRFVVVNPSTQYVRTGVSTEGDSRSTNLMNHTYSVVDTFSLTRGRHTFKFGGDLLYSTSGGVGTEFGSFYTLGQFTFKAGIPVSTPTSALTLADATKFTQTFGNQNYNVTQWLWSGFAQDSVRIRKDLTLNLGVRYDRQTFSDSTTDFAPRVGIAYNIAGDAKTVLQAGYGIYYSQLRANLAAPFAQSGPEGTFTLSVAPGQVGFPTSLAPLPAFPAGAVLPARDLVIRPGMASYYSRFFDVSKLKGYPDKLLNPYTQQASLGIERQLAPSWTLSADYVFQHTIKIDRVLDLNAPAPFIRTAPGQTRTASAADATRPIVPVNNGYRRIQALINNGNSSYNALQVNLTKRFSHHLSMLASYTWSHTINDMETDNNFDPNDANMWGRPERASSLLDQRHRVALSGWYDFGRGFSAGTLTILASGRPYNLTTGVDNNGDGTVSDRPVINGAVVGRNAGRGTPVYNVGLFVQREFRLSERVRSTLRAETDNFLNHSNITGRQGLYGNLASGLPDPSINRSYGQGLVGISNVDPARSFQFLFRLQF
jgi:Carboxypeptidase regulatory-like domain/TonB dependent receptor